MAASPLPSTWIITSGVSGALVLSQVPVVQVNSVSDEGESTIQGIPFIRTVISAELVEKLVPVIVMLYYPVIVPHIGSIESTVGVSAALI